MGDTTWYRGRRSTLKGEGLANPVASSSSVEPSQRAERGGSLFNLDKWLKVRANPLGKPSFHMETRQVKVWEDRLPFLRVVCW